MDNGLIRLRCFGVGALVLGLFASAHTSLAQSVISDLSGPTTGEASSGPYESQDFSALVSTPILSATLDLDFSAAAVAAAAPFDVYVYHADGSGPTAPLPYFGLLGTITPTVVGSYDYSVNIVNTLNLVAGHDYAVLIDSSLSSGTVAWEYTTSANAAIDNAGNPGTFLSGFTSPDDSTWTATDPAAFQLQVTPEPSTNAFMGFGLLALLVIHRMRVKHS